MDIGLPDAPGSGNHICNHLQGFNRRETLRKDRSNLRVGERTMLVVEAVGSYSLSLPSGLVLELETCYYVPKMIKNILSFDLLVDQATPSNGLYILNLQESNNKIYHISKRSKDIKDQTYLWHCRLGHINKNHIELLQKGGLLGTSDFKPFSNCESCLSGKMTKHSFNKDNERANDLLEIIDTDVCGPFSHEARGGYRYFITFTNDFSRYGYVYLIRHKSETFEKFKEFQSEVQNQLDRKIKFLSHQAVARSATRPWLDQPLGRGTISHQAMARLPIRPSLDQPSCQPSGHGSISHQAVARPATRPRLDRHRTMARSPPNHGSIATKPRPNHWLGGWPSVVRPPVAAVAAVVDAVVVPGNRRPP
ncbi:hypothetical protein OSB04_028417 [Centaurea solstitialis]|uniref:GAG-pre-integrase domain-containing protein n=1 Tax=Centaurea solstitialis TaxID=347529 RepID=A0AA38WB55_9ASTR|nr:hypothetical protein OSB04_028417 [Centaurea solstitialis]